MIKGNVLIGQSGGPTSVINSSLCGVIEQAKKSSEINKIYGMRYGIEGFMNNEIVDLGAESDEAIKGLRFTPSSILGSCRYKVQDSDFPKIFELIKKLDIRYYFMIGGNDTMDTIHRVEEYCGNQGYELFGIGIPKTVDNDLYGTDYTPGFPSAARYVALSVQQAGRLARDMQKVDKYVINQTVGRDAGWLAASSVLARGKSDTAPHMILIPERPINKENFVKRVKEIISENGWISIVCGEGIVWEDGTPVSASESKDKFSNIEFGAMGGSSAAMNLHKIINSETEYRGEFQVTESLPMCAIDRASELDLEEAYTCGVKAVELAASGVTGKMVTMIRKNGHLKSDFASAPLADVAVKAKPMPDNFIAENGMDVTEEFVTYLKPLVGDIPEFTDLAYNMLEMNGIIPQGKP